MAINKENPATKEWTEDKVNRFVEYDERKYKGHNGKRQSRFAFDGTLWLVQSTTAVHSDYRALLSKHLTGNCHIMMDDTSNAVLLVYGYPEELSEQIPDDVNIPIRAITVRQFWDIISYLEKITAVWLRFPKDNGGTYSLRWRAKDEYFDEHGNTTWRFKKAKGMGSVYGTPRHKDTAAKMIEWANQGTPDELLPQRVISELAEIRQLLTDRQGL